MLDKAKLTRRSFAKLSASMAVAGLVGGAVRGEALAAVEEPESREKVERIRTCCRGCGKMECGVWVTVRDGRAVAIEGDESSFQSMANCCSKSKASLQAAYHPDRLRYPMKRTNPKGEDPGWVRITWDEAFATMGEKFNDVKERYGGESLFAMLGTSRVWSMAGAMAFRQLFNTPNNIAAFEICKGPRHMATMMISEMAFSWQAIVEHPRVYVQWGGAAESSNYDDSGRMTVDVAKSADYHIVVDPRTTNLSTNADIHLALRPGTDGAMALSWLDVVIEEKLYDDLYVRRWTNGPFLVVEDLEPSGFESFTNLGDTYEMKTRLLKESDLKEGGDPHRFMVWDELAGKDAAHPLHGNDETGSLTYFDATPTIGLWEGEQWREPEWEEQSENIAPGTAPGRVTKPSQFDPDIAPALYGEYEVTLKDGRIVKAIPVWQKLAERCAQYAPDKAAEICGVDADLIRKAARLYATRLDPNTGYGNGGIQYMLAVEHGTNAIQNCHALALLADCTGNFDTPGGMRGPTQAVIDGDPGLRSWALPFPSKEQWEKVIGSQDLPLLKWWRMWGHANAEYKAMVTGEPYPLVAGINMSGDMLNQGNTTENWEALKHLDFFVQVDLWNAPTADLADILLPCTHWLEIDCVRSSQGSHGAMGATCKVIDPPGEAKFDVDITIGLYKACGQPWGPDPENPWPDSHGENDLCCSLIGKTWDEYKQEFQEHGWWDCKELYPHNWGTYRRYETGALRARQGVEPLPHEQMVPGFNTPTMKEEVWSTVIETYHPDDALELPDWHEPPRTERSRPDLADAYPLLATTGRRIPVYFHSEHRQLPWCRELWPVPRMEINPADAERLGIEQGDWCWIETEFGKIRETADLYYGVPEGVVNLEHQWWYPEITEPGRGFQFSAVNQLISPDDGDPLCGSSNLRAYMVNVYKATAENSPYGNPCPCLEDGTEIIHDASDARLKEWLPQYDGRSE